MNAVLFKTIVIQIRLRLVQNIASPTMFFGDILFYLTFVTMFKITTFQIEQSKSEQNRWSLF